MDTSKLLRRPLKVENMFGVDTETTQSVISPDKKSKVVFSHSQEIRMGSYEHLFSLLDSDDNLIDNFEPLIAISNHCCWKPDSSYFGLAIRFEKIYGFLLIHWPSLNFTFIKVFNPYPLDISFKNHDFVISYNDQQVAAANTSQLFGGGTTELPYKKYFKPADILFNLAELKFYSRDRLEDIPDIIESDKEYKFDLIDGGFNEFHGTFPQDTITGYNRRAFEVYQLEAFAAYGDKVSKFWLEEIQRKTNNKYNKWNKVSDYIGHRRRQEDEKSLI
ncbi:LEA type 2 family protein [Mucilaginibacter sp. BT774]|uniref:NDR1/HIN1-like protein n=1 Tax=Mucilaginibacter sp. BT774 TaxID=3062276 RepID=UPI002674A98E|nr:LEA type 2 family protein [Mucilaginibacter sp. BT774]MDO3628482.1 LEA type 2 family protein [Mucilaginibacter sp. BT774]